MNNNTSAFPASSGSQTGQPATTALVTVRIDHGARLVSGIRCIAGSPLFVERFVSTQFTNDAELSLAVAEVAAALGRPRTIGIISDFPSGKSGPADGTAEAASRAAAATGHAVRYTSTQDTGDVVPAHEVDAVIEAVEGTGIAVGRVETVSTARYRAVGKRKPRRRISGSTIPNALFEAEAATPEQMAPLVGATLGLEQNDPAGDLRPSVAPTASPPAGDSGGLGWSVQPVAVPVAFNVTTLTDRVELHYTLLAHALSMVALVLASVLL